jgi:BR serine/threonine kinase
MMEVVQTHIIPTDEFIDDDVIRAMNSLGCFKDKEKLKSELLLPSHNTGMHYLYSHGVRYMPGG